MFLIAHFYQLLFKILPRHHDDTGDPWKLLCPVGPAERVTGNDAQPTEAAMTSGVCPTIKLPLQNHPPPSLKNSFNHISEIPARCRLSWKKYDSNFAILVYSPTNYRPRSSWASSPTLTLRFAKLPSRIWCRTRLRNPISSRIHNYSL